MSAPVAIALPHDVPASIAAAFDGVALAPVPVPGGTQAAAELLRTGAADAVLLDLRDGDGPARELAALVPGARLVGLLEDDAAGAPAALAAGVSAFLSVAASPEEARWVLAGDIAVSPSFSRAVLGSLAEPLRRRERELAPRARLAEQARRAFEAPGALQPVFQPIADLQSGKVLGYLALSRFAGEPEESTGRRFAEAHALGLGADLELAAARAALQQLERVPDDAALFVKLSCSTLADERATELVGSEQVRRVVFELAGHPAAREAEAFNRNVAILRDSGVRFSADETGASFGALDRVLDLAPSFIRLARGLTRDIDTDRTRRALALAVTTFATHLGARVIADAIETAEELTALRHVGVTYGLGFHVGRPGPLPDLPGEKPDGLAGELRDGPVLWAARPKRHTLPVPRAHDLDDAARNVLRALAGRVPGTAPYLGLLDREAGLLRIVDVGHDDCAALYRGATFPLEESFDLAAAEGCAPQVGPAHVMEAMAGQVGASGYAVVPFAGEPDRPLATVSLAALGRCAIHPDMLGPLREAGALLADALRSEHGTAAHRQEHALRTLSWRDRFSGLSNATRFREELVAANARSAAGDGGTYVVLVKVANFRGLTASMGQAVAEMVLKDAARTIAAQATPVDVLARVGAATFGCVLYGRRPTEAEYFCRAVEDLVVVTGRRRGATVTVRTAHQRLGLGTSADEAWEAVAERALTTA
jgi:EAL domain-containing protein (putative c-di-GMP-specific phosphodiesterase class I)/GGDEF domain-containing protein